MLKQVKFSNFKMFNRETIIDLVPTKSEILKESNVENGILRGGFFYGGNASGKTTALNSISILLDMLFKEFVFLDQYICSFSKTKIAKFEYIFEIDGNEIIYSFSVKIGGIIAKERLLVNKETLLERIGNQGITELLDNKDEQSVPQNILFLRLVHFNSRFVNYPILAKWFSFLSNSIYIDNISTKMIAFNPETFKNTRLFYYLEKNNEKEINDFFQKYNFPHRINYFKKELMGNVIYDVQFENLKTKCKIPFNFESYGNKLLVQLLPSILTIKKTGGMLLIDEFGGGLHNKLTELIVNYLFKNTGNTQIFIVTHETNLLKTNLIRPDQIFILDYDEKGSYLSKASNQSPRESQNLEKMYLSGVFGGIPLYD